jgi:mannose/fructose/N-acetylgalactosamine-specific phosphotransferase system component IIC
MHTAIISFLGAVLCLDRIFLQSLVSRPVVAGTLTGFFLGDVRSGLTAGALVELLWIDYSPIGVSIPPNDTLSSVLISACIVMAGWEIGEVRKELIAFSVLCLLPAALIAQKIDTLVFRSNDRLAQSALEDAAAGNVEGVQRKHLYAAARHFLCAFPVIFILSAAGTMILARIFPVLPEALMKTLYLVYNFLPVLGIGIALNTINLRGMIPVLCSVFLVAAVIIDLFGKG